MLKMCQLQQFVTWDRSFCHMDRRTYFADVLKASFEEFERVDVVVASYENFERNWVCCGLFFTLSPCPAAGQGFQNAPCRAVRILLMSSQYR